MKSNLRNISLGMLLSMALSLAANAVPITFSSQGSAVDSNEFNSLGPTIAIVPHQEWAPALSGSSWVSYGITGNPAVAGYFVPANGTVVSFYETLNLPFSPTSAFITYGADDSAALFINNVMVRSEAAANGYTKCSDVPVGCTATTEVTLDITSFLHQNSNTLRFDVAQRAGASYGLDYAGFADGFNDISAPEPGTMLLIGGGLMAAGFWRRKR